MRKPRKGTLVIVLLLVSFALLVYLLPQFYIGQIRVSGQRVVTKDEIIKSAGLRTGEHILFGVGGSLADIFSLRHPEVEKTIADSFPYVKSVVVRSELPSVLSVALEERIEVAYISIQDGYLLIDAEGVALEVLPKSELPEVPVIEGIIVRSVDLGSQAGVDKQDYLNQTAVLLNSIFRADMDARAGSKLLGAIRSIRPVGEDVAYLKLAVQDKDDLLNVKVRASDDIDDDMLWLRFALDQQKLSLLGDGVLDMSTTQRVFVPED